MFHFDRFSHIFKIFHPLNSSLFSWSDQCAVTFVFLPLSIFHLVCSTISLFDDYSFFPLLSVVNWLHAHSLAYFQWGEVMATLIHLCNFGGCVVFFGVDSFSFVIGMMLFVLRPNSICTGLRSVPSFGVLRRFSSPM